MTYELTLRQNDKLRIGADILILCGGDTNKHDCSVRLRIDAPAQMKIQPESVDLGMLRGLLMLRRMAGEKIFIGDDVVVEVVEAGTPKYGCGLVRIGVMAPRSMIIKRS
jgi:sRNA-binding carbon storage regulator CsrA